MTAPETGRPREPEAGDGDGSNARPRNEPNVNDLSASQRLSVAVQDIASGLQHREAEEAVIGSLLQDGAAMKEVTANLQSSDFYFPSNEIIFDAIRDLVDKGIHVDLTLVGDHLQKTKDFERIGGALELTRLLERVPSAANIAFHAGIVRERADRRRLVLRAGSIVGVASDLGRSVAEAQDQIQRIPRSQTNGVALITRRAADVELRAIRWLWRSRIPRGMLTILAGPVKVGKSLLTADIVARVTRGSAWPDGTPNDAGPMTAILVNVEDAVAEVQRPRLEAAGADLSRVVIVDGVGRSGAGGPLLLDGAGHIEALEAEIRKRGDVGLVVFDPASAFFRETNAWKDTDLRPILTALGQMAERTGVAVVVVHHLNKRSRSDGSAAVDRVSGSGAFTAAARSNLLVGRRAGERRSILTSLGGNLAAPPKALAFEIVDCIVGAGIPTASIDWDPTPFDMDPEDLLRPAASHGGEEDHAQVDEWLRDQLDPAGTTFPSSDIEQAAKEAGISDRQLKGARRRLRVESVKIEGGARWGMSLPVDPSK